MYFDLPIVYDKAEVKDVEAIKQDFLNQLNLYDYANLITELYSQEDRDVFTSKIMGTQEAQDEIKTNQTGMYRVHPNSAFKVNKTYLKQLKDGQYTPENILVYMPNLDNHFVIMSELDLFEESNTQSLMLLGIALCKEE